MKDLLEEKRRRVKQGPLPRHVAIIMDGNARWAERRGLPRIEGYSKGIEAAWRVVEVADGLGIGVLTLYAFSKENWRRPRGEVEQLMKLLEDYLRAEKERFIRSGMRLRVLGDLDDLPLTVRGLLLETIDATREHTGMLVNLALSYSGRWEIVRAVREVAERARRGELLPQRITEEVFSGFLLTSDLPDPDLMIRTSGEKRISNFLLWQMAYTEFYFTEVLWPDFGEEHFLDALLDFQSRERRFGLSRSQLRERREKA